jgi:ankyrin repeat protein
LIDNGADLEAKNYARITPLHLSSRKGNFECLQYLIGKGANLEAKDYYEQIPLHSAAKGGHLECLKYLIENKADLEAKDNEGSTPLHFSAQKGHLEGLKYLIDKGAYKETKDNDGRTPLHSSAREMWNLEGLECLTFLIAQKVDVNATDKQNNTPLHILGKYFRYRYFDSGYKDITYIEVFLRAAEELIKAGADLTAVNNKEETPIEKNYYVQQLREQKPELFLKNQFESKQKHFRKII